MEKIREKFREYYRGGIIPPVKTEMREFGIGDFGKKISARHLGFRNASELHSFLIREAPFYISHSISYYEFPEARPMEKKNWMGADLVFDLDADDAPCKKKHEPKWFCTDCLENIKNETIKLSDILSSDFGISLKDQKIIFSGNKGYHIHVRVPEVQDLDQNARKEIVEYVRMEDVSGIKANSRIAERISQAVDGKIDKRGSHKLTRIPKKAIKEVSVAIDRGVTFDLSKLIRMPDSLHGSSGLKVCYINDLNKFDPFRDSVVFGDEDMKVKAECPSFVLKDQSFGPFRNEEVVLPAYAAIYLVLKNRGVFV